MLITLFYFAYLKWLVNSHNNIIDNTTTTTLRTLLLALVNIPGMNKTALFTIVFYNTVQCSRKRLVS